MRKIQGERQEVQYLVDVSVGVRRAKEICHSMREPRILLEFRASSMADPSSDSHRSQGKERALSLSL